MKAEMVQPGAVVYSAALAECRWAGEHRHVDYLLKEMEAEGLSIVPGSRKVCSLIAESCSSSSSRWPIVRWQQYQPDA